MTDSLANIFKAIANTSNEQSLNKEVVPQIGEYFAAKRCRLFIVNRLPRNVSSLFKTKPTQIQRKSNVFCEKN